MLAPYCIEGIRLQCWLLKEKKNSRIAAALPSAVHKFRRRVSIHFQKVRGMKRKTHTRTRHCRCYVHFNYMLCLFAHFFHRSQPAKCFVVQQRSYSTSNNAAGKDYYYMSATIMHARRDIFETYKAYILYTRTHRVSRARVSTPPPPPPSHTQTHEAMSNILM